MFTAAFWKATFERAVKTFAQALVAAIVAVGATTAWEIDWKVVVGTAALATLLSVLSSIATGAATDGNPSLNDSEVLSPPAPPAPPNPGD